MMKKYMFQIQNCINVIIESDSVENARMWLVEHTDEYADEMVDASCYISDGEELNEN